MDGFSAACGCACVEKSAVGLVGESVSSDQSFPDFGWKGVAAALKRSAGVGSGLLMRSARELPLDMSV